MRKKVFVLFVEPMLYGLDLIREVYEKSGFHMQYYYCNGGLVGKDKLILPDCAVIGQGDRKFRKRILHNLLDTFRPDFCIINGYTGIDQIITIRYCISHKIPYGIDSDTPLHIPRNPLVAFAKKIFLYSIFHHKFCYGIPGGTLQKENFEYYGIQNDRVFIRPMSVSSERIQKEYENLPDRNTLKKKFGVDGKTTYLFVGRLETVKSVNVLIEAYTKIKNQRENIALLIVGDGSQMDLLQQQVNINGVKDVYFEGYQIFPRLIEYYKAADVFVLPSNFEQWGLVVNEAMTCGLPCIVSSHVGCRLDLIKEGKTGYIFESENVDSLADCMQKIINVNLNNMRYFCLQRMEEWNFKIYLATFIKKVLEICDEKYK